MSAVNTLEEQLFAQSQFDLGWAGIIASGIKAKAELKHYLKRLDYLCQQISLRIKSEDNVEKANVIFNWLWTNKPKRYQRQGNFRLTQVIEAQLDEKEEAVGNCLGLTLLYNILCQRFGLKVRAVHLEEAFGWGPHVFSLLVAGSRILGIENIFDNGFDYKGHIDNPGRQEWGDRELIADLYLSEGNSLFEQGDFTKALVGYNKALRLNPSYLNAYRNKGLALVQLGRMEEAKEYLLK